MLAVSDFQILIKSCSIESRNDPSPKSEVVHETKFSLKISYSTHAPGEMATAADGTHPTGMHCCILNILKTLVTSVVLFGSILCTSLSSGSPLLLHLLNTMFVRIFVFN